MFFAVIWIAFSSASGVFQHFHKLPMGVHQSAQCDRASLAQNYFYGGMHFFYPEVNENRCIDGIVSCELPLPSFLAACAYKLLGYDEFYFRLITYLFFSLGMFALFLLFNSRINKISSMALVLILQLSPILLFYGANFIPDTCSLGLALIAWYSFFKRHIQHTYEPNSKSLSLQIIFILSLGFSVAIKTTSLIQFISMSGLLVLSYLPFLKIKIEQRKSLLISLLLSFCIPLLWYLWSKYLSLTHNSQYFMMSLPHSESWDKYFEAWAVYLANWPPQALSYPLIYIAVSLWFITLFLKKFIQRELYYLSVFNSFGSLLFLFLMIEQFKYHDYYFICLFPAFALNWLALSDAVKKLPKNFWWFKIAIFIAVLIALNFQFYNGRKNLEERYTEGNYWEQSHHRSIDIDSFRLKVNALGINRNNCVLVGYDPSPNNLLYLLHLRGHRLSKDHDQNRINDVLNSSHPQYFISNDTALSRQLKASAFQTKLELKYKYLELYKINYDSIP